MGFLQNIFIIYFIGINLITFIVFGIDKRKAVKHRYRIPEKNLFGLAIIGGSVGAWLGMYVWRHKTRVWYFVVGIPAILILQIAVMVYLVIKG